MSHFFCQISTKANVDLHFPMLSEGILRSHLCSDLANVSLRTVRPQIGV